MAILSVFITIVLYAPIVLGIFAIILGMKAYKQGDLEFGEVGIYGGAIGIFLGIFIISFFRMAGEI